MFNTLVTYLVYIIFLFFTSYLIAFTSSFFLGIIFSYFINSRLVFKRKLDFKRAIFYPIFYFLYYISNLSFLYMFVEVVSIPEEVAPILVLAVMVPVMFIINKSCFYQEIF